MILACVIEVYKAYYLTVLGKSTMSLGNFLAALKESERQKYEKYLAEFFVIFMKFSNRLRDTVKSTGREDILDLGLGYLRPLAESCDIAGVATLLEDW